MIRINFYHSLIFFNLCILLSGVEYLREGSFLIISLFLILTIGISHGSLDHIKGKKLLKYFGYKSMSIFYLGYLFIGTATILIWFIFPKLLLILFLITAAFHFGKEDSEFINQKKNFELIYFLKGSLIISSPLFFHKEETIAIFETLNFYISNDLIISKEILFILILLSLVSGIILSFNKSIEAKSLLLMDFLSILILNYFLNPIIAFTVYFCFLHSIRHSISLIREINKNLKKGLPLFIKKALPLTILTILGYVVSISILNNYNEFNETIYRVIFIGLASLTFPHILLEYLIEKNEQ
tara:strand:- start:3422 stop:4315 length:894 start_codon:yes stop_codon:yes gene_type:complete